MNIPYRRIEQDVEQGLIRRVLALLPAHGSVEHADRAVYVEFTTTTAAGLPDHIRQKFPKTVRIMLGLYRGLDVGSLDFTVGVTFGGVWAQLTVPYSGVTALSDPAAGYYRSFEPPAPEPKSVPSRTRRPRPVKGANDKVVTLADFRKGR